LSASPFITSIDLERLAQGPLWMELARTAPAKWINAAPSQRASTRSHVMRRTTAIYPPRAISRLSAALPLLRPSLRRPAAVLHLRTVIPKRFDEQSERWRELPTTWIVELIAGERCTPLGEPAKQPLAGVRRRDAPGRTGQQAKPQARFEPPDAMTQRRLCNTELRGCPRETALLRHRIEGREIGELFAPHSCTPFIGLFAF
jgi:hypothetical protein